MRVGTPLVDRITFLANGDPLVTGERDQAVAGDAGQDRAGQRRRDQRAIVEDEEDVHAAQLLDPALLGRVEEHDLVEPWRVASAWATGWRHNCRRISPRRCRRRCARVFRQTQTETAGASDLK